MTDEPNGGKTDMKFGRVIISMIVGVALLAGLASPLVSAADKKSSSKSSSKSTTDDTTVAQGSSGSGVQGYASDSVLQIGSIVELSDSKAEKVAVAKQANLGHMYGVVVDPHTLSVTISNASLKNETYVATAGTYDVLVSTQGGAIGKGDYVTLSAIDGVAMKATEDQKTVFGRAATAFDSKSNGVGQVALKDTAGKAGDTVTLGIIPVAIDIKHNPNDKSTKANVPKLLQRVGQAIAEKPVGPLRIYLSIAITGISIIVSMMILYSGVRSSLYAIGRNPLGKKVIFRGLLEIILTSIIILIIGLFAVYLLLKL